MHKLNVLVAQYPNQEAVFRIVPSRVEAALARASPSMPPVEFGWCATDDPAFGERVAAADAMIGFRFPTEPIAQPGSALKLIQVAAAGIEHLLPLDWLPRSTALATASGVHAPKIREWATMVFLMLHSRMPHFVTAQRAHMWSKAYSSHIAGRAALIVGTGGIGASIAAAARSLGLRTTGVRRNVRPTRHFDTVIGLDALDGAMAEADFVVLAMPLTPSTRHIMNADRFKRMKPEAGFANFGRGGLVDQEALRAALVARTLGGAIIDVTDPEPLPSDSPLWDAPRLIVTPHLSCDDPESYVPRTLDLFLDNIRRCVDGRPIRNRVVRSRAY
jgi:phosphoglycerate dehydrogenase-like enzyme